MATKGAKISDNPAFPSSSEEEEVSGSSVEESEEESSDEESKPKNDGDELRTPIPATVAPIVEKKSVADSTNESDSESESESDSESESESGSDSDPEPTKTTTTTTKTLPQPTPQPTLQVTKAVPEPSKTPQKTPQVTKTKTVSAMAESSAGKRPLAEVSREESTKKKAKMSTESKEEEVKKTLEGETKKTPLFQRVFSEKDEIALLQGILDFTASRGDPSEALDVFCEYVKKIINFDANRNQIVDKVRRLKRKFFNCLKNSLKKGKKEDDIKFLKASDQKSFELSRMIWGNKGVLVSNKGVLISTSKKKTEREIKTPKVNTQVYGVDITSLIKKEVSTCFGLDESELIAGWNMVADETIKKEIEEKMKKLKAMQVKLWLERSQFVTDTIKMMFNGYASSSSE